MFDENRLPGGFSWPIRHFYMLTFIMKVLHIFTMISTPRSFFNGQFKYLAEKGNQDIYLITSDVKDEYFCNENYIKYKQMDIARRIDILADLKSIKNIANYIKKEKFDVVVGHTPKGAMVAMIASFLTGIKTRVYYRHGLIYTTASGLKKIILKSIEKLTAFLATHIVNVSPSLSTLAVKDHLNSDKKQIVIGAGTCGGIDAIEVFNPEKVNPKDIKDLKEKLNFGESFIIGFAGRICKEKGIRELIDGFNIFIEKNPTKNAKLLLLGPYDKRDALPEEYKLKINSDPNIIAPGIILNEDMPKYYSLIDILVLPSYREGFGMCVIEAGAMRVPSLVSKSHGCVDSVKENVTGKYIEISAEGVERGLESMMMGEERTKMGIKSRENVLLHYDQRILWPKIIAFYNSLTSKSI